MANGSIDFKYALIVNTDKYAGNFEREMCAYATGGVGECEVGDAQAEMCGEFLEENGFASDEISSYLAWLHDDRGCARPVSIYNDEGNSQYNDLIIYLEDPLPKKLFYIVVHRLMEYGKQYSKEHPIDVHGARMIKRTIKIVDEYQPPVED